MSGEAPVAVGRVEHRVEQGMFLREVRGDVGCPTLLFLHGLGESGLCFEAIILHPALKGLRSLVPDLPGYGRTARPPESMDFTMIADHAGAWLASREGGPVILVGHSMGGVLALVLAERHPGLVSGVVDVDGNKSAGDCKFSGRAASQSLDDFCAEGYDALCEDVFRAGLDDTAMEGYHASLRLCDARAFHGNACELVSLSEDETMANRLATLPVPAFYIAGAPGGACRRSLELLDLAGVPCTVIERSGHWPFVDQPDRFAETLVRIVSEMN